MKSRQGQNIYRQDFTMSSQSRKGRNIKVMANTYTQLYIQFVSNFF